MPLTSVASLAIRKTWMNLMFFFFFHFRWTFDLNDVTDPSATHSMTFRLRVYTRFHKGWHFRNIFFFCFFFPRNKRKNKRYIYFLYVNLFENKCIFIDRNGTFSYLLQFSAWIVCSSLCKHSLNAIFACRDQRKK